MLARTMAPVSIICIGSDGWTNTESSLPSEQITSAAAFHKEWWRGARLFHRDGHCYQVASATPARPLLPLSRVLANTIYNPRLNVRYEYRSNGRYALSDLQQALGDALDKDDDILTQFHHSDDLKRRLSLAQSFDDVVDVLDFAARDTR
jgi:hypothetical protein